MAKIEWVKVEDSEGLILAHDLTGIVPFKSKGAILRKGHRIKKEDIPLLLKIGKEKASLPPPGNCSLNTVSYIEYLRSLNNSASKSRG